LKQARNRNTRQRCRQNFVEARPGQTHLSALFATVRADIQLFVSKSVVGDTEFDEINELDLGDWVGVTGLVMTTRKGELSIKVEQRAVVVEGSATASRQVARTYRRGYALSPALRRLDH
jgi:lysyl-tRNA synthetase class II